VNILGPLNRALHSIRSMTIRGRGRAVILLYHRVTDLASDPQWLSVPPRLFAEHLELLKRHYRPHSLDQLCRGLSTGKLPRRTVVVTFDDGYADNLLEAKPLLERFDVPATVFVATGKVDGETEFWWDELEGLLIGTPDLPASLDLTLHGRTHSWSLAQSPEEYPQIADSGRWNVTHSSDPTPRHRAYRELAPIIRELDTETRESVLRDIAGWAGVARGVRSSHRALRPDEVAQLASGGLIEVGAHTVTHPVLSRLSVDEQRREIRGSRERLEALLGHPVNSFSYPFGTRSDYTEETVAAVRDAGFTCACSNFPGLVRSGTDAFQLPRWLARDWNGDEFRRLLDGWFKD
jgi:peptidoglycan/xylan/chitin deacetylase (PgdA/CDA1 family)